MTTPSRLYQHLPPIYDRRPDSDLYKLLSGFAAGFDGLDQDASELRDSITVVTAKGQALNVLGANVSIPRPPGLDDSRYALLIRTMQPAQRGTLAAIGKVLSAATGQPRDTIRVDDKSTDAEIPDFEIWVRFDAPLPKPQQRGFYPSVRGAGPGGFHITSAICGRVLAQTGWEGGLYNDHWWAPVDRWTRELLESVRLAGTVLFYK